MSNFGKNLKKIRSVKGLSQQAIADILNLKRGTLGAYEEGRSEPKIDTLIKLANYFNIPIDTLLIGELTVNQLLQFKDGITLNPEELSISNFTNIPFLSSKEHINYISQSGNNSYRDKLPKLQLPYSSNEKKLAFEVFNLEMTNQDSGFYPEDIAIATSISINALLNKKTDLFALVLCLDHIYFRKVQLDNETLILSALHKNVKPIIIPVSEIIQLWEVEAVFMNRLPQVNNGIEEKLRSLEEQLHALKNHL